jgi:hypothetical protein
MVSFSKAMDNYTEWIFRGMITILLVPVVVVLIIASPIALFGWIVEKFYDRFYLKLKD